MQELEKQGVKDKEIISFQLGRNTLSPIVKVAKRCREGFPQVVFNFPTKDGKTWFPTIFWLTCPYLHYEVSKIENTGAIKKLEAEIARSPFLRKKLLEDQKVCLHIRDAYFSFLRAYDPYGEKFFKRGIGGVSNLLKIKCLHLHYAFFLANRKGTIGELINEALKDKKVDPDFCGKKYFKYCGRRF